MPICLGGRRRRRREDGTGWFCSIPCHASVSISCKTSINGMWHILSFHPLLKVVMVTCPSCPSSPAPALHMPCALLCPLPPSPTMPCLCTYTPLLYVCLPSLACIAALPIYIYFVHTHLPAFPTHYTLHTPALPTLMDMCVFALLFHSLYHSHLLLIRTMDFGLDMEQGLDRLEGGKMIDVSLAFTFTPSLLYIFLHPFVPFVYTCTLYYSPFYVIVPYTILHCLLFHFLLLCICYLIHMLFVRHTFATLHFPIFCSLLHSHQPTPPEK